MANLDRFATPFPYEDWVWCEDCGEVLVPPWKGVCKWCAALWREE